MTLASPNRLDERFALCQSEGRAALILYLTAGFPDLETTARLLPALERAGADVIELGVPFSDPIADGPVIQRACARALEAGTTLRGILDLLRRAREADGLQIPVVLFGALNPFLRYGPEALAREMAACGAQGLLAADLPVEEAEEFRAPLRAAGLHLIFLAAPTTPEPRLRAIAERASGLLYAIALKGVTGARADFDPAIGPYLERLKRAVAGRVPVALGFGISTPEHARRAARDCEGVVVGSALIREIEGALARGEDPIEAAARLTRSLAAALRSK